MTRFSAPHYITHGELRFAHASAPQLRFEHTDGVDPSLTRGRDARVIGARTRNDLDVRACRTTTERRFDYSLSVTDNNINSEACNARLNGAA